MLCWNERPRYIEPGRRFILGKFSTGTCIGRVRGGFVHTSWLGISLVLLLLGLPGFRTHPSRGRFLYPCRRRRNRVGSSPKALDESEPSKADKWGGRLSALSEGRESRASGGSSDGDDDDVEDGTASLNKSRCMTGGTEETASPSSRRVSTESLPPAGATVADFAGLAGGVAGPGQDDDAEDDGADAAGDEKRARSRSGEGESDGSNPGREDESNNGNDRVQSQDEGVETDAAPAAEDEPTVCLGGGVPVPVPVPDPLAAAPDAALGLPLPATPAGSPEGKVSPAAPASSPLDPTELAGMETTAVVLPAELGGDVGGERSSEDDGLVVTAREEETQGGLRLNVRDR